jgi:hypothetical protein
MRAQRMVRRQLGVVEVADGVAHHPQGLHDGARAMVRDRRERDDLFETNARKAVSQRGPRRLAGEAMAPGPPRQPPAHLDRGRERDVGAHLRQAG